MFNFYHNIQLQIEMSALKEIKERLSDQELDTLTNLDLNNIKITRFTDEIKKYLEKIKKVEILILHNCDLESLQNLPNWKLTAVEISNNRLSDSCLTKLASIPTLTQIICVGNQIENIDSLKQLSALKKLSEVDFSENPVAQKSGYRKTLFDDISSLDVVDQKDKDGNVVEEQDEDVSGEDEDEEYDDDEDEQFDGDEDDDYEEESSDKPKKKRK